MPEPKGRTSCIEKETFKMMGSYLPMMIPIIKQMPDHKLRCLLRVISSGCATFGSEPECILDF